MSRSRAVVRECLLLLSVRGDEFAKRAERYLHQISAELVRAHGGPPIE